MNTDLNAFKTTPGNRGFAFLGVVKSLQSVADRAEYPFRGQLADGGQPPPSAPILPTATTAECARHSPSLGHPPRKLPAESELNAFKSLSPLSVSGSALPHTSSSTLLNAFKSDPSRHSTVLDHSEVSPPGYEMASPRLRANYTERRSSCDRPK